MGFLSKIGSIVLKIGAIATGFGPAIAAMYPNATNTVSVISHDLGNISQVIQEVEVIGQILKLSGDQKLTAAAPLVSQIILQSALMADHNITNPELFQKGCTEIAQGMVDILNSLHDNVQTVNKA